MEKLKKWLAENGFSDVNVKTSDFFGYNLTTKTILVGEYIEDGTEYFPEFLNEYGCDYADQIPLPILAFLHELGHYNTIHTYSPVALALFNINKVDCDGTDKQRAFHYWTVPDEFTANMWAIEYLMNEENFEALNDLFDIFKEIYA